MLVTDLRLLGIDYFRKSVIYQSNKKKISTIIFGHYRTYIGLGDTGV